MTGACEQPRCVCYNLVKSTRYQVSCETSAIVYSAFTPHGEADIQPAGAEDGQLGVAEGSTVAAPCGLLLDIEGNPHHFLQGIHVILGGAQLQELPDVLPERLGGLRGVDVTILPENDGEAVEGFGAEGGAASFTYLNQVSSEAVRLYRVTGIT